MGRLGLGFGSLVLTSPGIKFPPTVALGLKRRTSMQKDSA